MELIFNGLIGMILIVFFISSMSFSDVTVSSDRIGANGFPQMIIIISLILLIYITYKTIKDRDESKERFNFKDRGFKTMILSVGLLATYIFTLNIIGFILGTFIFSILAVRIMRYDDTLKTIIFSLILTASVTLIFGKVFFVALPRGIGILREISYLVY